LLGLGVGERQNLEPYGLRRAGYRQLAETLDVLRLLRDNGTATYAGRHLTLDRAPLPAPLSRHRLSFWLGAHGPRTTALAARTADGWLPVGLGPRQVGACLDRMGRSAPDAPQWTAGALVPVGIVESDAERERLCASPALKMLALSWDPAAFRRVGAVHPLGGDADPLRDFVPGWLDRAEALRLLAQVPDAVVGRFVRWGTVSETARLFAGYASAGVRHLVVWEMTHLAEPDRRARSMELLCRAWTEFRSARPAGRGTP
jgi:alkanesulfonate monooxygenase SsuD/methylene tetrahydromethanopterin reductase-like flavin-dependent oxidoreductase (luciferase family)